MASWIARRAQVPTRTFIVTQDETGDERGPYYFLPETVEAWIAANSSDMTIVGKLITITGDFANTVDNLSSDGRFQNRKNLVDLGTEYVVGNDVNSRIIVLRKVQGQNSADFGGLGGTVAYICVENNCTDTPSNAGRFTPRVARI